MKQTVVDTPPKRIAAVHFGVLSPQEIVKQAEIEVSTRELFDLEKGRIPKEHGALDRRMVIDTDVLLFWSSFSSDFLQGYFEQRNRVLDVPW